MLERLQIGISQLAYRLPPTRIGLDELAAQGRLNSEPGVLREFGFASCAAANSADELHELLIAAARETLGAGEVAAGELAALFLYSGLGAADGQAQSPLDLFRYPLGRVQYDLDLPHVPAMALSQRGCCGLLAAIRMGAQLLAGADAESRQAVLLLASDALPTGGTREIIYNLMSDGVGALLLERNAPRNRIVHYHEQVQPYYWDTPQHENELLAAYFPMAQRVITAALAGAGLKIEDVRWFVPHNVSLRSWRILGRLLGIPEEKIWTNNIAKVGHTVSCDHIINLVDMQEQGVLAQGDYLVLFTFGFGASWSCLILQH